MDRLAGNLKNTVGTGSYTVPIVFFIVLFGTAFCDIGLFEDSVLSSKWYWLCVAVSVCGILSLFIGRRRAPIIGRTAYLLIPLLLYGLVRAAAGSFMLSFLVLCSLFLLICGLSAGAVRSQPFGSLSAPVGLTALLVALYGIAQYAGLVPGGVDFRLTGNFDNPAGYASMLALGLPFVLYFTFSGQRGIRYAAWSACAIVCTAIALCGSRAGILTVIVLGTAYAIKRRRTFSRSMPAWKKTLGAGLAVIVLSGLYFTKKDSADGRLLIWQCTWDMIREKPLFGHGYKSFEAKYMLHQARYFEQNPESDFALLADNVKQPFNEFLRLAAEFGLVALLLLILGTAGVVRVYMKNRSDESFTFALALAAAGIFSCFSYPFAYPSTGLIVAFCIGGLSALSGQDEKQLRRCRAYRLPIAALSAGLLVFTAVEMHYGNRWHKIITGTIPDHSTIAEYERLYPVLKRNACFIYNYAAVLNGMGETEKSAEQIAVCERILNDYDVQMLKADDYKKQRDFHHAKDCYVLASQMCPARFRPLYELVGLYDSIGRPDRAAALVGEIADKPVKIPSAIVTAIKLKMKERARN